MCFMSIIIKAKESVLGMGEATPRLPIATAPMQVKNK